MREWLPHRGGFLNRLLNMEAPKAGRGCNDCGRACSPWRCMDCVRMPTLCTKCCLKRHANDFLHRIQKWTSQGEIRGAGDGRVDHVGGGTEFEGEGIGDEDEGGSEGEGEGEGEGEHERNREHECEGEGAGEEQWEDIVEPELIVGDDGEIIW